MSDVLTGIGVGQKPVRAPIFRLSARVPLPLHTKSTLNSDQEIARVNKAVADLEEIYQAKIAAASGELSEILAAQLSLASDPELVDLATQHCSDGWNAESAVQMAMDEFKSLLLGAGGEFGERVADLDEIVYRLVQILSGNATDTDLPPTGQYIVVAEDLTPMDTVAFTDAVVGVITEKGGPTSHTAIVCRSRSIPALVACKAAATLQTGQIVALDPENSQAVINGELAQSQSSWWISLPDQGKRLIQLLANVGSIDDAKHSQGASGVGLLRTELLFLDQKLAPSAAAQQDLYRDLFLASPSGEIIVRTLDAGSDKPIPFLKMENEENPALGVRGQRVAEIAPDFYRDQLIAIAAAEKEAQAKGAAISVSVMAPMIATVAEAKAFAAAARATGISRVGVMVEIPAIISAIPHLAGVIDFLSVGTNDLSQYLFAADRTNAYVAHLLDPFEPALLSALSQIAQSAKSAGIKSGVCGEAGSDPLMAVVLAGLGFDSVSASASAISDVEAALSRVTPEMARKAADAALSQSDARSAKSAARTAITNTR